MKQKFLISTILLGSIFWQSCVETDARYVDLNTGEALSLKKDSTSGLLVNELNGEPIALYVDRTTKDTIYGRTGKVVNGKVIKMQDGKYVYADTDNGKANSEEYKSERAGDEKKVKNGDYKKIVEKDGDIKIKNGDTKIKIDKTGERKVKHDD